jgi:hypothetical protein
MSSRVTDTDKGYAAMRRRVTGAQAQLTVGIHEAEGAASKEGADGTTVLEVAAYHEFGLGVPRRSFIADWEDEAAEKHKQQLSAKAKAVIAGTVPSVEQGLERLGNLYVGEVQKRIADGIDPPLAESTIRRKDSSKPLIDTGQLRSSIAYRVGPQKS